MLSGANSTAIDFDNRFTAPFVELYHVSRGAGVIPQLINVDDSAMPLVAHDGNSRVCHVKNGFHVDVVQAIKFILCRPAWVCLHVSNPRCSQQYQCIAKIAGGLCGALNVG